MAVITLDFETYYSQEFSLSKITTEEYIRDPRFEVIGVAVKVDDDETQWASGTHEEIGKWLKTFPWESSALLAHNTMFDGAILSWVFDIHPKMLLDTLSMGRAVDGIEVGGSLAAMVQRYELGEKGTEVLKAIGKRRADFTPEELAQYGDYCINDVELTYKLFAALVGKDFPKSELKLIDLTLRMFTEPKLELNLPLLEKHLIEVRERKADLLKKCSMVDNKLLMSNDKFAEQLIALGVNPPRKISLATNKETWAFAKSDEEFKALLDYPDERVQALVSARLGTKSTLEETRTERLIGIAKRGLMPVPLKYYAAHTGRWGGSDNLNLQNLPSRGANAATLKKAIMAPEGYVIIDSDSSQIEARTLAWFAGQGDVVKAFAAREDVYVKMAARIYNVPEAEVTKDQRFVGKTTILGCGYGMGAVKFQTALKAAGVDASLDECRRIVATYREANYAIAALWKQAQVTLAALSQGAVTAFGRPGVVELVPEAHALRLPNGMLLRYTGLSATQEEKGLQYSYQTRRGRTKIYGGKVVENVIQGLARIIIGDQMVRIAKQYPVVLTVHDAIACIAPKEEAFTAQKYVEECMRQVPEWAEGLPVNCESGVGASYGEC